MICGLNRGMPKWKLLSMPTPIKRSLLLALTLALAPTRAPAQLDLPPQPVEISQPSIRELPDGRWMVGSIVLDKQKRTLEFPAKVNMVDGLVEYVLVHLTGKTHESLLVTEVQPYHLQVAMLLLGAKGADHSKRTNAPPSGPINNADLLGVKRPPIPGTAVKISFRQQQNGATGNHRALDGFIYDQKQGKAMPAKNWTFTGSVVWEGAFIAQIEGSIIAMVTDIGAIFNSQLPNRDADDSWYVRTAAIPREGTPIIIRISVVKPVGEQK
jgi:hypothetical protein